MAPVTTAATGIYWLADWLLHMDCGSSTRQASITSSCVLFYSHPAFSFTCRRDENAAKSAFVGFELALAIFIALVAIVAAYLMWTGVISPL